jgi:hypothetical protein
MGRTPVTSDAKVIAASIIVQIVIEAAKLTILKSDAGETGSPGHGRGHDFHNDTESPSLIMKMGDFIADTKKKAFPLPQGTTAILPMIMFHKQLNVTRRRP